MPIFGVFADHFLEADRRPRRRMKQRLSLISRRPLRAGNEIFAPRLGSVRAAAGRCQAVDKGLLLMNGNGFHFD